MLITVMSERELHVPRLGRVVAEPGFRLVAAMNPFDAIGTARISSAVYDRVCRLSVDYQDAADEVAIVAALGRPTPRPGVARQGRASWCAAPAPTPTCASARRCAARSTPPRWRLAGAVARHSPPTSSDVGLDAALVALVRPAAVARGLSPHRRRRSSPNCGTRCSGRASRARRGKSERPGRGPLRLNPPPQRKEGAAADAGVAESRRRTTSRRELARHHASSRCRPRSASSTRRRSRTACATIPTRRSPCSPTSPAPPIAVCATWPAGWRRGCSSISPGAARARRGHRQIAAQPYRPDGGDLDLDASLDAIVEAEPAALRRCRAPAGHGRGAARRRRCACWSTAAGRWAAAAGDGRGGRGRRGPARAERLQRARVRQGRVVGRASDVDKPGERVVNDVLSLRGHGTTDLAARCTPPAVQLARSRAARKIAVLLSDCRATVEGDVAVRSRGCRELVVVAPEQDCDEALRLRRRMSVRGLRRWPGRRVVDALTTRPRTLISTRHGGVGHDGGLRRVRRRGGVAAVGGAVVVGWLAAPTVDIGRRRRWRRGRGRAGMRRVSWWSYRTPARGRQPAERGRGRSRGSPSCSSSSCADSTSVPLMFLPVASIW